MKIWITMNGEHAFCVKGLYSLDVWFAKPRYKESLCYEPGELPFGGDVYDGSYTERGWEVLGNNYKIETSHVSFGNIFPEALEFSEIRNMVWEKLVEHFGTADLALWQEKEKNGICEIKDFILEIDINFGMKSGKSLLI